MKEYYVEKQAGENGANEVHTSDCNWLPSKARRILVGKFAGCQEALVAAQKFYSKVNGCKDCSPECHTE